MPQFTVRSEVKSGLLLACVATLAAYYFDNTPIPLFLTRLKQLLIAAVVLCSAGGWGIRLLALLAGPGGSPCSRPMEKTAKPRNPLFGPWENLLFAEVAGLGALSWGMIFLGVIHAWIPAAAWLFLGAGLALSGPFVHNLARAIASTSGRDFLRPEHIGPGALVLTGSVLSFTLALAPVTYYDSLVYHFTLPAAYLQAHHWVPLPGLIYSAFPQALEMLWTLGLLVADDTVANLLAWSLSVLLMLSMLAYAARFLDLAAGWMAAALIAVMPAFLLLSSGGYVDVGLALFSFLAFYAACAWKQRPERGFLVLSGLFAGSAAGAKYTGALGAGLILFWIAAEARKRGIRQGAQDIFIYAGSALLVCGPWLVKNTIYVGNPVFPFFHQWGIKALNPWINEAAAGYFAGIMEYYSRSLLQLPKLLADVIVNGIEFGRGIDVLGDYGWIPLFSFLPALWVCRKRPAPVKWLLSFSVAYFLIWGFSRPVLRFLLPIAPFLALLAGYGWTQGIRTQGPIIRWVSRGFLGTFLISGLFLFLDVAFSLSLFPVAVGLEDRRRYLARQLNYYEAASFINAQTPADSVVYVFGDQRGYYYDRKTRISPVFSKNPLIEWANAVATPQELAGKLKEGGITHLLFNREEFERLKVYPFSRFTPRGETNWRRLQAGLKTLYQDRACTLYSL